MSYIVLYGLILTFIMVHCLTMSLEVFHCLQCASLPYYVYHCATNVRHCLPQLSLSFIVFYSYCFLYPLFPNYQQHYPTIQPNTAHGLLLIYNRLGYSVSVQIWETSQSQFAVSLNPILIAKAHLFVQSQRNPQATHKWIE